MVVQRTLDKIEQLKERPHHERRAIAAYTAYGVAGLLLLGWGFVSLNNLGEQAQIMADTNRAQAVQTASAAGALESSADVPTELVASSTNGRVELVPRE